MKSGNLNFLEPSGPLQACNRTALPLPLLTSKCAHILNAPTMTQLKKYHVQERKKGRTLTLSLCLQKHLTMKLCGTLQVQMHALTQLATKHVFLPEPSWCLDLLTVVCLPSHAVKFVSVHLGKAPFFSDVSSLEGLVEYLDQV
jgi:hypothetical protein